MAPRLTRSISLQPALSEQADALARQLNISPDRLFELALEAFVNNARRRTPLEPSGAAGDDPIASGERRSSPDERLVNQGDIFWIRPEQATELGAYPHPYVVIQDDILNHSRINTIVVCGLTTNLKQAKMPGNILLDPGEADLPKHSVVDVSRVSAVARSQLGEYIGAISQQRIQQILAGMRFLHLSFFGR